MSRPAVDPCELPAQSLLAAYRRAGSYADCYATQVARTVSHAAYVEAFYTTGLFRLERQLLAWFAARPSSDGQAQQLARGTTERFAAWQVEARAENQLLLCDFKGRTRSWLMSAPGQGAGATRLFFGSAVVPAVDRRTGRAHMGFMFKALLGFHRLYSRALLRAAARRLARADAAVK